MSERQQWTYNASSVIPARVTGPDDDDPELRAELEELSTLTTRPTTDAELREFMRLAQEGWIMLFTDRRIDPIPWVHFPKRLAADLLRAKHRCRKLLEKADAADAAREKAEQALAKPKRSRKR